MALFDGTLTTAAQTLGATTEFPLPRDVVSILRVEPMVIAEGSYSALTPGAAHPDNPGGTPGASHFYFMEDRTRRRLPGGVLQFDRVWHNVWQSRNDYETRVHTLPELKGRFPWFHYSVVSKSSTAGTTTVTTDTPHSIQVGDRVIVKANFGFTVGGQKYQTTRDLGREVTAAGTSTTIAFLDVDLPAWADSVEIHGIVDIGGQVRAATNRVVNSRVAVDYWIVGVTDDPNNPGFPIADPTDIPIIARYAPEDAYGAEVPYFSSETTPSQTTYQAAIDAGTEIVAVASQINHIGGQLYERKTVYVTAA